MNDDDKIAVSAKALRQLLTAVVGPPHYILELLATRGPLVGEDNPINILIDEYNAWAKVTRELTR